MVYDAFRLFPGFSALFSSSDVRILLTALEDQAPWFEAEVRIALARAALRLGDVTGARTLLAEAAANGGPTAALDPPLHAVPPIPGAPLPPPVAALVARVGV